MDNPTGNTPSIDMPQKALLVDKAIALFEENLGKLATGQSTPQRERLETLIQVARGMREVLDANPDENVDLTQYGESPLIAKAIENDPCANNHLRQYVLSVERAGLQEMGLPMPEQSYFLPPPQH
jgi:hypothetical protein|tara:strand:- start:476 stop:850 length:375 start_codon:yes stop_codon:yes gene_type:complete